MNRETSSSIVVGYLVDEEKFLELLKKDLPETSHYEDRYNEKTGKKLTPQKVIDGEERTVCEFRGKIYESDEDNYLLEDIGKYFKCSIIQHGNFCDGDFSLAIESCKQEYPRGFSHGECLNGFVFTFKDVAKFPKRDLGRIGRAMQKFGFELGSCGIWPVTDIS